MPTLTIPYADGLPADLGLSQEEFEGEMRFWVAAKLFQERTLSLGRAADIAGIAKIHFMDRLDVHGVPVVNLDREQLERELRGSADSPSPTRASFRE